MSSITSAHQILVFKEGCLVQKGRHDELHVTTGIYKNMWNAYINAHNWKLNLKNEIIMITKAIKHITIGQTKRLYKPVGYTMLANFINIVPFCLSIEVINTLLKLLMELELL